MFRKFFMLTSSAYIIILIDFFIHFCYYGMIGCINRFFLGVSKNVLINGILITVNQGFFLSRLLVIFYVSCFISSIFFLSFLGSFIFNNKNRKIGLLYGLFTISLGYNLIVLTTNYLYCFIFSLFIISFGHGLLKPNLFAILNGQYSDVEIKNKHLLYIIYSIVLNIGAFLGMFILSYIGHCFYYLYSFLIMACVMPFITLIYYFNYEKIVFIESAHALEYNVKECLVGKRLLLCTMVLLFDFIYRTIYFQTETFNDMYVIDCVRKNVYNFSIPNAWLEAINPLVLSTLILPLRSIKPYTIFTQLDNALFGIFLTICSYIFIVCSLIENFIYGSSSLFWMILYYILFTIGEIYIVVFSLSFVVQYRPSRFSALFLCLPQIIIGFSSIFSAYIGTILFTKYYYKGVFLFAILSLLILFIFFMIIRVKFNKFSYELFQDNVRIINAIKKQDDIDTQKS